jgi:hypothetical protein
MLILMSHPEFLRQIFPRPLHDMRLKKHIQSIYSAHANAKCTAIYVYFDPIRASDNYFGHHFISMFFRLNVSSVNINPPHES